MPMIAFNVYCYWLHLSEFCMLIFLHVKLELSFVWYFYSQRTAKRVTIIHVDLSTCQLRAFVCVKILFPTCSKTCYYHSCWSFKFLVLLLLLASSYLLMLLMASLPWYEILPNYSVGCRPDWVRESLPRYCKSPRPGNTRRKPCWKQTPQADEKCSKWYYVPWSEAKCCH